MMATAVYSMCAFASTACAVLLFRVFWQHRHRTTRLVLWSSLSFACFAVSNALVFADLVVFRTADLAVARAATACLASAVLLFGLIWETE
ncbi:MAG TPA: DUF5985 family protein [Vicinamibacterales bacterium]|jgi:hypothetical protein|nr:DUF5985 family protein [Vicinamibacterales bacterium]